MAFQKESYVSKGGSRPEKNKANGAVGGGGRHGLPPRRRETGNAKESQLAGQARVRRRDAALRVGAASAHEPELSPAGQIAEKPLESGPWRL